jgi:ABC-type antimicrobial peptide transport system permease subunit
VSESVQLPHLRRVFAAFGALALARAAVGVYGVLQYSAVQRTREFGIRMALGAQRGSVFGLVLREVLGLALAGVLIGTPLALAIGKLVELQL